MSFLFLITLILAMCLGALLFGLGFSSGASWERNQRQEIDQLTRKRPSP